MSHPVRLLVLSALAAALFIPVMVEAQAKETLWIASGPPGFTYRSVYARNLERELRGWKVAHRSTSGSRENLQLLAGGEAQIALAQADVFAQLRREDPQRFGNLLALGKLADECVYVAHRKSGSVDDLDDLESSVEDRAAKVAVGPEDSGASGTWKYLTALKPGLAAASVEYVGDTLALNQLTLGVFDAVVWVTDPRNMQHKMLNAALGNDALEIMDLDDSALVSSLEDGTQIYVSRKVKLEAGWRARELETVCTSALMLVNNDADPKLVTKLSDLMSLHLDRLVPQDREPR